MATRFKCSYMPQREVPILPGEIYHVFNKTIDHRRIYTDDQCCLHFLDLVKYYRSTKAIVSHSKLKEIDSVVRNELLKKINYSRFFKVNILSYCLMPTHFHFLLYERKQKGIERFIGDIINAITRYYNLKNDRTGPIFHSRFRAVHIKSSEQLLHVSRYIHLNPYSASIVQTFSELKEYRWSSYYELINGLKIICEKRLVLKYLRSNIASYIDFAKGNADYQKTLEYIKHTKNW